MFLFLFACMTVTPIDSGDASDDAIALGGFRSSVEVAGDCYDNDANPSTAPGYCDCVLAPEGPVSLACGETVQTSTIGASDNHDERDAEACIPDYETWRLDGGDVTIIPSQAMTIDLETCHAGTLGFVYDAAGRCLEFIRDGESAAVPAGGRIVLDGGADGGATVRGICP